MSAPRGQKLCLHDASSVVCKHGLSRLASWLLPNPSPGPRGASHLTSRARSPAPSLVALGCPEPGPACQGPQTSLHPLCKRNLRPRLRGARKQTSAPVTHGASWCGPRSSEKAAGVQGGEHGLCSETLRFQPQARPVSSADMSRPPALSTPLSPPPLNNRQQPLTTGQRR